MRKPRKLRSRKAGLPPGTLVHIGEIKTPSASYSLIDFDEHGLQETRFAEPLALTQHACQHATRWANVYGASSPTDLATVGSAFGLHPLVQEDILNNAQRQKLDAYEDYL